MLMHHSKTISLHVLLQARCGPAQGLAVWRQMMYTLEQTPLVPKCQGRTWHCFWKSGVYGLGAPLWSRMVAPEENELSYDVKYGAAATLWNTVPSVPVNTVPSGPQNAA